ncbi:MAG: hypothetical protein Q7J75_02750 [Rhodoferax sp.]|nr:hypothetical protein [Rhodoferax sp.]
MQLLLHESDDSDVCHHGGVTVNGNSTMAETDCDIMFSAITCST